MFQNSQSKAPRPVPVAARDGLSDAQIKAKFHQLLVNSVDVKAMNQLDEKTVRRELKGAIDELFLTHTDLLRHREKDRLAQELVDEMVGFGPLEILLRDPTISDILINGPNEVHIERHGRLEKSEVRFSGPEQLLRVIQRIAGRVGRRIDESSPMVDARLPDGSRFNAVIAPLALDGALVSIRRSVTHEMQPEDFVAAGAITSDMLQFLQGAIAARLNVIVAGGTGSGKTTLLNMLSGFISPRERIVTIEDAAELRLRQPHVARMETRVANIEGKGCVTTRDLVRNALRMRPDRVIVGECRGEEAFDMLQAMNTGHDGSLTTIHANTATDAIGRLEMLLGMAQSELPMWYINRQIGAALDLVIHVARLSGGVRKVTEICEVCESRDGTTPVIPIFHFEETGVDAQGHTVGEFKVAARVPDILKRINARGGQISESLFAKVGV